MAKSLRSNRIQKNKSKLRSRVFGPVEEARTLRLSQRLAEIAASAAQPPKDRRKAKAKDAEDAMAEDEPAEAMREEHDDAAAPSKDEVEPGEGTPPHLHAPPSRRSARTCRYIGPGTASWPLQADVSTARTTKISSLVRPARWRTRRCSRSRPATRRGPMADAWLPRSRRRRPLPCDVQELTGPCLRSNGP
jgi:hypothetical protein